ncbi:unnamed protein product [Euphydryas editha]|uniref:Uncharacterized protein n=1 Tax=Euphydryas editha TaxID=104508 RepID=A0AAU9UXB6_EUPED|nr:unnamed protein product [Euphydryas editha]
MVRKYNKKTKKEEWCKEAMKKAVEDILAKRQDFAKQQRYVNKIKQGREIMIGEPLGPIKNAFIKKNSNEKEMEIATYLKHMEERLFGLITLDLRRIVYELTLLGDIYDQHKLTPDRIFNCDETGISVLSKTKQFIVDSRARPDSQWKFALMQLVAICHHS